MSAHGQAASPCGGAVPVWWIGAGLAHHQTLPAATQSAVPPACPDRPADHDRTPARTPRPGHPHSRRPAQHPPSSSRTPAAGPAPAPAPAPTPASGPSRTTGTPPADEHRSPAPAQPASRADANIHSLTDAHDTPSRCKPLVRGWRPGGPGPLRRPGRRPRARRRGVGHPLTCTEPPAHPHRQATNRAVDSAFRRVVPARTRLDDFYVPAWGLGRSDAPADTQRSPPHTGSHDRILTGGAHA